MNHRTVALIALVTAVFVGLIATGRGATYDPGVSVGQWVKYGNFVATGTGAPLELSEADWMKVEVTAVSGKNVTLHTSGKYRNGTDAEETNMIVDLETGTVNGSTPGAGFAFVIPRDLQAGDSLPTATLAVSVKINKTETRTYLGAARSVNIVSITVSSLGDGVQSLLIYDKVSGMVLEANATFRSSLASLDYGMSYGAIDTNIFPTGTMGWLQDNMIYVAIAIIIVLVLIVAAFMLTRKKPSLTPPSPEEATPETQPTTGPNT